MPASDRGDGLATDGSGAAEDGSSADDGSDADDAAGAADASASPDDPTDQEVVQTAAEAAENVIFSRFSRSNVSDVDVSVSFEDGILEVDVYLDAEGDADPDRVADDAALAARGAVDDLFE